LIYKAIKMPVKNKSLTVTYTAIDANGPKAGDGAAHTIRLIRDGVVTVASNAPAEVDAANCPGEYSLALTAAEMNVNSVVVCGKSTTSGVQIVPVKVFTDQGLMPVAMPGAAGGFVVAGVGANQLSTSGAGLVTTTDSGTIAGINGTVNAVRAQTDKMLFNVNSLIMSEVDDYVAGLSPEEQILLTPGNRIGADGAGQINLGPVTLAANGLDAVTLDGRPYNEVIRWIFAAAVGEISYDPATGTGTVSQSGNPGVVLIRFQADPQFLTRTGVVLTTP
jgi:hypothetical protein